MSERSHLTFILILGALIALGPLSIDMYLPAFTRISAEFSVSLSQVEISLTSYFIGLAAGQLFYGPLADRFGRKRPLYIGLLIYIVSSMGCALSESMSSLIAFRLFQAVGGCSGIVISRAMVRDLFGYQESIHVFSQLILVMGLAPILAPLVGGYIAAVAGWRFIFWLVAVLAICCLFAIYFFIPETAKPHEGARLKNAFRAYGAILSHSEFLRYAFTGGFAQAGLFAYITGSPFVLIQYFGVPPESYGWFFGFNAFGLILMSQLNRYAVKRFNHEVILSRAILCLAVAGVGLLMSIFFKLGFLAFIIPLFAYVSTLGFVFPNTMAGALKNQGHQAGAASALLGTLQFTLATAASAVISASNAQTPLPLAATICTLGTFAFIIQLLTSKT